MAPWLDREANISPDSLDISIAIALPPQLSQSETSKGESCQLESIISFVDEKERRSLRTGDSR
jgi:hypothetical protein